MAPLPESGIGVLLQMGGTLYLAVDLRGKVISDPKQLIQHIKQHVAEGRKSTPDGSPKICSRGFV